MNVVLEKILGIDVGTKRVGVAIAEVYGQRVERIRSVGTYSRAQNRAQNVILEMISRDNVVKIVIGLPLDENGSRTEQCDDIDRFTERLRKRTDVVIEFHDEYLSSVQAKAQLGIQSPHSKVRKKGDIDAVAASILLSEYIKARKH